MTKYELMTISKISLGESGARTISNSVKDLISSYKGKIINSDFQGKKRLAYEIKHDQEGYYEVMDFELDSELLNDLKTKLNLQDGLVRYLVSAKA